MTAGARGGTVGGMTKFGEDGDGAESFEVVERNLAGLDGLMQQYLIRLAAASAIIAADREDEAASEWFYET